MKSSQKAYKETVHIFRASNQHGEVPQLFSKSKQNFILIIDGIWSITKREIERYAWEEFARPKI